MSLCPPRPPYAAAVTDGSEGGAPTEVAAGQRTSWSRVEVIVLVAVTLLALVLRLYDISDPPEYVFDEVYYAKDACFYAGELPQACDIDGSDEQTFVHPPLGKWAISAGVQIFGFDSFGYRIVPAIAGVLTVALLFLLARRLTRSLVASGLAALLLALDPLHFVQSRTSMLDIFLPLFGLAAVLFLVIDRDQLLRRADAPLEQDGPTGAGRIRRPWRAAAGIAVGAAIATKWSGGLILLLILFLALAWETAARPETGRLRAFGRALRYEGGAIVLALVLLPLAVYLLSYIGRVDGDLLALPWQEGSVWRNLAQRHHDMFFFHKNLEATHNYQSPAWSWIALKRPVSYFFCSGADCEPAVNEGIYQEILATGNPFAWWMSGLALVFTAGVWSFRRNFRGPEGTILAGFALTYLPWIVLDIVGVSPRSAIFLFYLLPTIPFMYLALGYVASRLGTTWEAKAAIGLFTLGTIGLFAFYFPLLAKRSIPEPDWRRRLWIFANADQCAKPPVAPATVTTTTTEGGRVRTTTSTTTGDESRPPRGWCWI